MLLFEAWVENANGDRPTGSGTDQKKNPGFGLRFFGTSNLLNMEHPFDQILVRYATQNGSYLSAARTRSFSIPFWFTDVRFLFGKKKVRGSFLEPENEKNARKLRTNVKKMCKKCEKCGKQKTKNASS